MYLKKILKSGVEVAISVPLSTEKRLGKTCFRGVSQRFAGNFMHWNSALELFCDEEVLNHFLAELHDVQLNHVFGTYSVNITHTMPVGWESTDALENYTENDLEVFSLNRKSKGLRVKSFCKNLFAPQTHRLTIVYQFEFKDETGVIVVRSIYPGKDIGELNGNVTNREKRIFFDWNHPGQV